MAAGGACEGSRAGQYRRNDTREVRGKGKKVIFLFLGGKIRRCFLYLLCGDSGRSAAIAALGYRHRRGNGAGAVAARGGTATQLVAACGRSSLSSLYTLDTYAGAQSGRNGWMSVFSSLCIYIVYHKFWQLSKMESGRKWKGWKILEGAGLREMDMRKGVRGREWKGG